MSLIGFIILSKARSKQAATAQRLLRNVDLQLLAGIWIITHPLNLRHSIPMELLITELHQICDSL